MFISHIWKSSEFNYIIIIFTCIPFRLYLKFRPGRVDWFSQRATKKGNKEKHRQYQISSFFHYSQKLNKGTRVERDTLNNFISTRWQRENFLCQRCWCWCQNASNGMTMEKFQMWWGENFHVNISIYRRCNPDATGETSEGGNGEKAKVDWIWN